MLASGDRVSSRAMSVIEDEALALVEEKCQEVFRFGDKYLPPRVRGLLNELWHATMQEQEARRAE
jgi:hypothetical protein